MNSIVRTAVRRVTSSRRTITSTALRSGAAGVSTPNMPPFARNPPPTGRLPEEVELVWDDSVAPETAIDFDAPHVDDKEVHAMIFGAAMFFASVYGLVALSDPVGNNPVATRDTVIPKSTMQQLVGDAVTEEEEE